MSVLSEYFESDGGDHESPLHDDIECSDLTQWPIIMNKYFLYEKSTQSPDTHVRWFSVLYEQVSGRPARDLREDFCGTFLLCQAWVKDHPENTALGLDLDPEPLAYGEKKRALRLPADQKRRLSWLQQDVLKPTRQKKDMIIACNFSFYTFKTRDLLRTYFHSALKSLRPSGLLVLEMAGGPGMIRTLKESKTVHSTRAPFRYIWDQQSFDPISNHAKYAIHFKLSSGKMLKDAFTYDWRIWSIPEVRELLEEAGFSKSIVFWEKAEKGKGTGEYYPTEVGDNDYAWIAYVVGVR